MSYFSATFRSVTDKNDLIQDELWEQGALGIEENVDSFIAFFAQKITREDLSKNAQELCISIEEKASENWMENWKENFKPQFIGERFIVKPTWEKVHPKKNQIVIDIDPKMAFGTGTHETTQLVLTLLPKYFEKSQSVFDFGTGSGILAIAAEKLGAKDIVAIDIDEESIINANENKDINRCTNVVFDKSGLHSIDKSFNLILANINKHILLNEAENIMNRLKEDGCLIVSGLLIEDEAEILEKYKSLKFIEKARLNEWIAIVYKK